MSKKYDRWVVQVREDKTDDDAWRIVGQTGWYTNDLMRAFSVMRGYFGEDSYEEALFDNRARCVRCRIEVEP